VEVRNLVDGDKDNLVGKAKAAHISKANQGFDSLLPVSRQVFSQLQESRAPSHITVTWEDKCHHSKCPPLASVSPSFIC